MPNMELLEQKVRDSGVTITFLCDKTGLDRSSYYNKISGKREFKISEVYKIRDVIGLSQEDIEEIFFS